MVVIMSELFALSSKMSTCLQVYHCPHGGCPFGHFNLLWSCWHSWHCCHLASMDVIMPAWLSSCQNCLHCQQRCLPLGKFVTVLMAVVYLFISTCCDLAGSVVILSEWFPSCQNCLLCQQGYICVGKFVTFYIMIVYMLILSFFVSRILNNLHS